MQDAIIGQFAFIPGRLTLAFWPERLGDLLARANLDPDALQQAALIARDFRCCAGRRQALDVVDLRLPPRLLGPCRPEFDLDHRFWAAGRAASRRLAVSWPCSPRPRSPARLSTGLFNMMDFTPLIGASAADSGLMAAATRFIFEPGGPLGGAGGYSRSSSGANFNVAGAAAAPIVARAARRDFSRHLAGDEFHIRRRRANLRPLGSAGRLARPSRRLRARVFPVSAVRLRAGGEVANSTSD